MVRVESYCVGLCNGHQDAFEELDARIAELGDVEILSVTDTYYPPAMGMPGQVSPKYDSAIVRVVMYR